jgi:hypothetical protein
MAYVSQDLKAKLAPTIKAICKKHGVKASLAVNNHSTLVLNIKSGKIDFIGNSNRVCSRQPRYNDRQFQPSTAHISVNPYWYQEHFDGDALAFLKEVMPALNTGNHNNSDVQTDYFDVGWYVDVNVGKWDKPYTLEA